ncbi:MAG: hypothetical protein ABII76_13765 [Pseudomonadota bacterium]
MKHIQQTLAGTVVAFGLVASAQAQTANVPPVINPLSATATLPKDGTFDLRGVSLGMLMSEAIPVLQALHSAKTPPQEVNAAVQIIRDNRGNEFRFATPGTLLQQGPQADGSFEILNVSFTTNVNEVRAYAISRSVSYSGAPQQGSVPELVTVLTAKYGTPSWRVTSGAQTLYWVWFNGTRVAGGDARPSGPASACTSVNFAAETYANHQGGISKGFDGCDLVMSVRILPGQRPDLMSGVEFGLYNVKHIRLNVQETDAWVRAELQKIIDGKQGSAPKL